MTFKNCFCNDNRPLLANAVEGLCANIPHGIYTLSIVQKELANDDKYGRTLRDEILFGAQTHTFDNMYGHSEEKTENRLLEYYCLTDSNYMQLLLELVNEKATNTNYPFETEQTISGYVKHTFKKVDDFTLKVFVPTTGEMQDLHVDGNRFKLRGLDFCDGATFTFQAIKKNGSDRYLDLHIDAPTYPDVSVKKYHVPFLDSSQMEMLKKRNDNGGNVNLKGYIQLEEVVAKGKFRPMNRLGVDPDRAIGENDPLLEKAPTIESLVYRFGLRRGYGFVKNAAGDESEELISVESLGHISYGRFVPCEVMLDDDLVYGYALSDILNINPLDVKQIEYFLPSNYEMFGNLAGIGGSRPIQGLYGDASNRGLLMIWTKSPTAFSYFKHNKPLSVVTVKQLGYMPMKSFDAREVKPFDTTKYWNSHFIPQEFNETILEDITLDESTKYIIKIEGISDEGQPVSKQIYY